MIHAPRTIGFLQAVGVACYVSFFAVAVRTIGQWSDAHKIQPAPVFGIILFLLAFIISGVICVSLMFGYPGYLFARGDKSSAVKTVLWSIGWLVVLFAGFLTVSALVFTHGF